MAEWQWCSTVIHWKGWLSPNRSGGAGNASSAQGHPTIFLCQTGVGGTAIAGVCDKAVGTTLQSLCISGHDSGGPFKTPNDVGGALQTSCCSVLHVANKASEWEAWSCPNFPSWARSQDVRHGPQTWARLGCAAGVGRIATLRLGSSHKLASWVVGQDSTDRGQSTAHCHKTARLFLECKEVREGQAFLERIRDSLAAGVVCWRNLSLQARQQEAALQMQKATKQQAQYRDETLVLCHKEE